MMKTQYLYILIISLVTANVIFMNSCVHDPLGIDGMNPVDTTDIDTTDMDTSMADICHPDTVYFLNDVMPIIASNCAIPQCHDAITMKEGVILTTYESIIETADVRAFDLDGSDLYEVITETDRDKVMPPLPRNKLSNE